MPALVQMMACRLFGDKRLSESMSSTGPLTRKFRDIWITIHDKKIDFKISSAKVTSFVQDKRVKTVDWSAKIINALHATHLVLLPRGVNMTPIILLDTMEPYML